MSLNATGTHVTAIGTRPLLLLSAGPFTAPQRPEHRQTHKSLMAMCYCQRTPGQTTATSWCPHQRSLWAKKIFCWHLLAVCGFAKTVCCHQQSAMKIVLLVQVRGKAPQTHAVEGCDITLQDTQVEQITHRLAYAMLCLAAVHKFPQPSAHYL